jgi:hypothetical protein
MNVLSAHFEAQPTALDKMMRYSLDARPPSLQSEDTATPSATLCVRGLAHAPRANIGASQSGG